MENIENFVNAEYEEVVNPQNETSLDEDAEKVVDSQNPETDTDEGALKEAEEVATPHQSKEDNQKFAELRRAKEQAESMLKTSKDDADSLVKALNGMGYGGKSIKELSEEINAQSMGVTVEQYRLNRQSEEIERQKIIDEAPEIAEAKRIIQQQTFDADLKAIKEAFPDADIENVWEIGDTYIKCRQNGIDAVASYSAQLSVDSRNKKPIPPSIGKVEKSAPKKEYFTEEELDNLSEKDLDDEKTLMMALKSLERK